MEAIDAIMTVNKLFKLNKWVEKDKNELVFNGFCNLFTKLEPDELKLILELIEKYLWISYREYQDNIIQAMEAVSTEEIARFSKIYFFAIINPKDEHKVKSGEHLLYIIKAFKHLMIKYQSIRFEFLTTFAHIQNLNLSPHDRIFLVDDYIGSGETLESCLVELKKNTSITSAVVKILCIAIQEHTEIELVLEGYAVLKSVLVKKGITDYNHQPQIDQKKNLMRGIERNVLGAKSYSLGYKESEALITMMRTPDNTFPVFWKQYRKDGKFIDAPFARYEEI